MRSTSRETEDDRCLVYWDDQQDSSGLINTLKLSSPAQVPPHSGQQSPVCHVTDPPSISSSSGDCIPTISRNLPSKAPLEDQTSSNASKPAAQTRPSRPRRKRRGGLKQSKRAKECRQLDYDSSSKASLSSDSANTSNGNPYSLPSHQQAWDAMTAKLARKHRPTHKTHHPKINSKSSQTIKLTSKKSDRVTDSLRNENITSHHPSLNKEVSYDPPPPMMAKFSATAKGTYNADSKAGSSTISN